MYRVHIEFLKHQERNSIYCLASFSVRAAFFTRRGTSKRSAVGINRYFPEENSSSNTSCRMDRMNKLVNSREAALWGILNIKNTHGACSENLCWKHTRKLIQIWSHREIQEKRTFSNTCTWESRKRILFRYQQNRNILQGPDDASSTAVSRVLRQNSIDLQSPWYSSIYRSSFDSLLRFLGTKRITPTCIWASLSTMCIIYSQLSLFFRKCVCLHEDSHYMSQQKRRSTKKNRRQTSNAEKTFKEYMKDLTSLHFPC